LDELLDFLEDLDERLRYFDEFSGDMDECLEDLGDNSAGDL